ncbi:hypothetical protein N836_22670 [Leptolyngbya sp. Heron Island J]|uniref:hypothetical protein n=1 Tax=Leptolyngbya sp. Heron Island J TaxID=1385935 RepID=UPI0003B939EE|nr:hypothetical protein [Leptolyngbya sp. Heron Island J]ESA33198.1 hypothetical protein N836_22670 [Leptolyngbya sp. Heron Island J]
MAIQQGDYENLLARCSDYRGALTLLKQHRPYLEMLPSMRRPQESIVTIPLPNISVRRLVERSTGPISKRREVVSLPCDLVILMCDPEWKVKTGVDVVLFIHRPDEDFSELLSRWRQTQILLSENYEWLMPMPHEHLLNEGSERPYPLFVTFPQTPERILRGLNGAELPVILYTPTLWSDPEHRMELVEAPQFESEELIDDGDEALREWGIDIEAADESGEL